MDRMHSPGSNGVDVVAGGAREFSTRDVDQARVEMVRAYYPLRVEPIDTSAPFSLWMRTVSLGPLVLGKLTYGSDITKDCGDLAVAFHVNVPLSGRVWSTCGDEQVVATPDTAAVFNPTGRTVLDRWVGDTTQLCLKMSRTALEGELSDRLDRPLREPLRFRMAMDLRSPAARSWLHAVQVLADELESPGGLAAQPLLAQEVQRLITAGLLWGQPHSYYDELREPGRALRPRTIKLVVDAIEARPEYPWTAREMAQLTGVGVRSVEDGFRRHLGESPTAYLRRCRLERVRAELAAAGPGEVTVAEVAHRWGFSHLGRFARAYRERYGELPSVTLRS
jgi:AraC-like DNA-binding protein